MTRRRRRAGARLAPEDRALWEEVVRSLRPLHGRTPPGLAPQPQPDPRADPTPESAATIRRPLATGPARPLPDLPAPVGTPEPGLDAATARRLRRGLRKPDARIDLHGMTAQRAHAALDRFIADSVAAGHRCVLVITGKGGRAPSGDEAPWMQRPAGVLRHEAPRWLRAGPAARHIVGVYRAHLRHGGSGAFYVYLRKQRPETRLR